MTWSRPHRGTEATELARAKVNLCLHVTGQRPDGYHLLDSIVAFPKVGDLVEIERSKTTSLTLGGPFGADLAADGDNLVLRAALLVNLPVSIRLTKSLPIASGIGGGSADAAATIRALAQIGGRNPTQQEMLGLGADVPVCLASVPTRMRGIGDRLDPLPALPECWCVLVNPGFACPTAPIFAALASKSNPPIHAMPSRFADPAMFFEFLHGTRNDLQQPAIALNPEIGAVIDRVASCEGCGFARMSGSGATVFGLFEDAETALAAADALRGEGSTWWVAAAPLGA